MYFMINSGVKSILEVEKYTKCETAVIKSFSIFYS